MGRRLPLLAVLVPLLAACALPGTDAADIGDCEDKIVTFWVKPEGAEDWDARVHHLCEGLIEAGLDDNSSEAEVLSVLRRNPGLSDELCGLSGEGLNAQRIDAFLSNFGGYVSREQAMRLTHDLCVYAIDKGSLFTEDVASQIYREHPYLLTPFCRAPLVQAYDYDPPPQPRRVYEEVATEVCMEGIRTGVVDFSSGDLVNPRIDQKRFRALLDAEWAKR
jgi:hypothetical protein